MQLKARLPEHFHKDGALPEVADRRFEAFEALRMHHWELVSFRQKNGRRLLPNRFLLKY